MQNEIDWKKWHENYDREHAEYMKNQLEKLENMPNLDYFEVEIFQWYRGLDAFTGKEEDLEACFQIELYKESSDADWEISIKCPAMGMLGKSYVDTFKTIQKEHAEKFPSVWTVTQIIKCLQKYWDIQALDTEL